MIEAILLIQDVQLLCFTIIFGFVALQHPADRIRRWFWYSFLANAVGAVLDFATPHLPSWISHGVNMLMIPLSYALINVAIVLFLRRFRWAGWVSFGILVAMSPLSLLWSGHGHHRQNDALTDLAIGLESLVAAVILLGTSEKSTKLPRLLMSVFFYAFAAVELTRAVVVLLLHWDPDIRPPGLALTSSVAYVVSTSVLPLAFLWLINSRVEAELVQQNMLDPLTHLLNRRGLRQALDRELDRQDGAAGSLTVAMLDLDHFKILNDTHGHAAGDGILIWLAGLLTRMLRDSDTVARVGGEEFVLLLPQTTEAEAFALLEQLRKEIAIYSEEAPEKTISVTASFGIATLREGETAHGSELIQKADLALYRAKEEGRNRVCAYTDDLAIS